LTCHDGHRPVVSRAIGVFDVLVVGGGPAGSAVAITVARRGLSVLMIERSRFDAPRIGEHLTPGAQPAIRVLGAARDLASGSHAPCAGIHSAWGSDDLYARDYMFSVHGHGWNLDRARFDAALARLADEAGATVLLGTQLSKLHTGDHGWIGCLKGDARGNVTVEARFLVDATGRTAAIARRLGSRRRLQDRLVALCGRTPFVQRENEADRRLVIEATPSGWWYVAPLPNGGCMAVFFSDSDLLPRGLAASTIWAGSLGSTRHARIAVPAGIPVPTIQRCGAHTSILEPMSGESWLAVGDAACARDPLSSSGIPSALQSGTAAADAISRSLAGETSALEQFTSSARSDFARYLVERQYFYTRERRWQDAAFWRRRAPPLEGHGLKPTLERVPSLFLE
jgi:flavin-dependent dehydrogenase